MYTIDEIAENPSCADRNINIIENITDPAIDVSPFKIADKKAITAKIIKNIITPSFERLLQACEIVYSIFKVK